MTKTLVTLHSAYLHKEEKNQIVARLITEIESSKVKITDEDVKRLLARLKSKLTTFQSTQKVPRKSEHTDLLKEADRVRDSDAKALFAGIRAYSSSQRPREKQAYLALSHLGKLYRGVALRHYEEETAMIASLLTHLKSETYRDDVTALSLTQLVNNLTESQTQFESLFTTRMKSEVATPVANLQVLRETLFEEYQRFCQFVDALAWGKGTEQYQKLLAIINSGRKYYGEVVAKRVGRLKKRHHATIKVKETKPTVKANTANDEGKPSTIVQPTVEETSQPEATEVIESSPTV